MMMGHLNQVTQIFDYRSSNALLRMMSKAMGRQAPTTSRRYDTIWDINTLLEWLQQHWADGDTLTNEDVQTKAMLLVMIFSACRLAELGRMEIPEEATAEEESLTLKTITKQRQEQKQQIIMRRIPSSPLCPVTAVRNWLNHRPTTPHARLFCKIEEGTRGGRELTTPDICRRFLKVMKAAGIPPHYTAYSIKHAVVTRLFQLGATEEQIGAYGHWAPGSHTAQRWYNITTLEQDWLGAKLVGQWLRTDPIETLEDFDDGYLPTPHTEEQAARRAQAVQALLEIREEKKDA
jgi:integrase